MIASNQSNPSVPKAPSPFLAFAVTDETGRLLGTVLRTRFEGDRVTEHLWWTVVGQDEVVSVSSAPAPISRVTRNSIGNLDRSVEDLRQCATPGEAALLEVKMIARRLNEPATVHPSGGT